ncbi:LemA family protein [Mycoplasma marinum]|uniref:LemA family protein n=1 Tax=Mycoplasma marinum TaxID=1937190 RepID=A0A4R0XP96_9MOLU|nr:LemA family protein [Mycoplasma marinum]TCG11342.1 LemA family protein [Mycoplasma marinum]
MAQLVNTRKEGNPEGFNPNVDNSAKSANASIGGKIIWYISFLLIIPLIIHVVMRNGMNKQQSRVNELASGIDVQLKKRRDTLIKLLEATKAYMKHEKDVLSDVTKLRKMTITPNNRAEVAQKTESALGRLIMTAENYPDLKANESITQLMDQASYLEREISAARRLYNSSVRQFNQKLFAWPSSVPATELGLATLPYFEASATDKKDVEFNFN